MQEFREQIQQEAYDALKEKSGTVVLTMRTGKSKIGLKLTQDYKNVIVAYPNKPILQSWLGDAEKFKIDISHVVFTTFASLSKYQLDKFDCLIIDEVDQLSIAKLEFVSLNRPKVINALTATPPRKGTSKRYYMDQLYPIRYEKNIEDTVGILNKPYHIYVHMVNPSEVKNIQKSNGSVWSEKARLNFFDFKADSDFRMMVQLINKLYSSPTKWKKLQELLSTFDRCLVFVETIEQARSICRYTYHSKNSEEENKRNLQMFNEGKINFLATVSQLNAGVTFPNLNRAIILHAYASSSKATQRIGRVLNFLEGEKAELHIICLNHTRDYPWTKKGLEYFGEKNITWIKPEE